jgi:GGDEF domain-containing protein
VYFGVIIRDLSATQSEQDALYQLANFDPVTQLPNRNLLLRHLDEAFGNGHGIALVLVDLDGFHDINTTLGRGWATVCCAMWPTASVAPCPRRG